MEIPIQNIYYLLSYAWNKLDESKLVRVEEISSNSLVDLLAKVLSNGMNRLIRLGLDRNYLSHKEEITTIRGRIDISKTLKRTFLSKPFVYCEFDELSHNVLHNQIIKTTLGRLLKYPQLDEALRKEVQMLFRKLVNVHKISLTKRHFGMVQLHSNNAFYDFLLNICELIHDGYMASEREGFTRFRDFFRDKYKMPILFEEFIRNFYKKEQKVKVFNVRRIEIPWDATAIDEYSLKYLPKMQTDIYLESKDRKIIIDTKYYHETLNAYYDKEKIHSANLYQLHAYLSNLDAFGNEYKECEGILLYPTVVTERDINVKIKGHPISIKTINLNQDWQNIHQDLLKIIEYPL